MEEVFQPENEQKERPQFLTILCMLTFIGSGLGVLGSLVMIFAGGKIKEMIENSPNVPEESVNNAALFDNTLFWVISLLIVCTSLFGAIKMYNLKKMGFHLYASANIIAFVYPLLYGMEFSTFGLISTAAFIGLYALNLKHMS